MSSSSTTRACAFCGEQAQDGTRLAAGYGVFIDESCVEFFDAAFKSASQASESAPTGDVEALRRYPVRDLTDEQVLAVLPRIAETAAQANRFMAEWVELIRGRKMSWTVIGTAMGISRQAAWERFTRALSTEKDPGSR